MSSSNLGSPPTLPRTRRLVRCRDDRMIAGVAGGLARHLGIDAVIVRIAFVVLALVGGGGLLAYLIAWVAIPEETGDTDPPPVGANSSVVAGIALVGLGSLLLLDRLLPVFSWYYVGPALLIVLGALVLVRGGARR